MCHSTQHSATTEPSCGALDGNETEPEARHSAAPTVQPHPYRVQGEASNLLRTGIKGGEGSEESRSEFPAMEQKGRKEWGSTAC